MAKQRRAFDIDRFVDTLAAVYRDWNPPIITFIANRGGTPFEILVSTILSLRTKDEVTSEAARRLFQKARTPEQLLALGEGAIAKLIYPVGFYHTKARRLLEISRIVLARYQGNVPDTIEALLELPGVGRKTANLVLVEGFKKDAICVDTHVHRMRAGRRRYCPAPSGAGNHPPALSPRRGAAPAPQLRSPRLQ